MRVGIYGGSFDPVHLGHLAVADAARTQLPIDKLHWMPVGSPWQKARVLAPAAHRIAMLRLALEGTSDVIDPRETQRAGPTYTVDTLDAVARESPSLAWMLVIGQDQYARLHTWHRWRDVLAQADLAVVARDGEMPATSDEINAAMASAGCRVHVLHMRAVPVSSTQIRARVARGESIAHMVPAKVAGYIDQHALYRQAAGVTTKSSMDIRKLQRVIVDGLEDVKAHDIRVYNTEHLSSEFERVIVASGTSNRQTKALAASVRDAVKSRGLPLLGMEGEENGEWIIVDCDAVVAHIMQPAIREYYNLEEIWGGKPVHVKLGGGFPAGVKTVVKTAAKAVVKTVAKNAAMNTAKNTAKSVAKQAPSKAAPKEAGKPATKTGPGAKKTGRGAKKTGPGAKKTQLGATRAQPATKKPAKTPLRARPPAKGTKPRKG